MPNKTPWGLGLMVLVGIAVILTAGVAIGEKSSLDGSVERQVFQSAVEDAGPVSFWAVVQKFEGSLEESGAYLEEFLKHYEGQGLDHALVGFEPTAIIILHSEPDGANAKGLIGLTAPAKLDTKDPLMPYRIRFDEAATYLHVGPYEQLGEVHERLAGAAGARSSTTEFPVVLRLLNDPRLAKTPRSQLVVPVENRQNPIIAREEKAAIARSVENASSVSVLLVSQKFEGSPEQIGKFLDEYLDNFREQGLGKLLDSRDVAPLAILHANPDENETIPIEIGLPISQKASVSAPLMLSDFRAERAASYVHQGPYEELAEVYRTIDKDAESAQGDADFPIALKLITDPRLVLDDEIKTGMIVPLGG